MKETGIIMSGSHPRDILEFRKTMTRRTWGLEWINLDPDAYKFLKMEGDLAIFEQVRFGMVEIQPSVPRNSFPKRFTEEGGHFLFHIKCPYGGVGDRLWVKETWAECYPKPLYKADNIIDITPEAPITWKSPRFMPRWASRILLEITEVRGERLQDISEEDAKSEGWSDSLYPYFKGIPWECRPRVWFAQIWDSLNAKRVNIAPKTHKPIIILGGDYSWESNPWVWVIRYIFLAE